MTFLFRLFSLLSLLSSFRVCSAYISAIDEWRAGTYFYKSAVRTKKNQIVGRVSVADNFCIEFNWYLYHFNPVGQWKNILHIGMTNVQRSPGIWVYPRRHRMHFRFSDFQDWNRGYDPNFNLRARHWYHIKFCIINKDARLWVDRRLYKRIKNVAHWTRYREAIWVGDPWHSVANSYIKNLEIWAPEG